MVCSLDVWPEQCLGSITWLEGHQPDNNIHNNDVSDVRENVSHSHNVPIRVKLSYMKGFLDVNLGI